MVQGELVGAPVRIVMCTGKRCRFRGSERIYQSVSKWAVQEGHVAVIATGCLKRCRRGPTLVIYPRGQWVDGTTANSAIAQIREQVAVANGGSSLPT